MAGVYIRRMEMPISCSKCRLMTTDYGCVLVGAVGYALSEGRRCEDCPLVTVPDHGRLIDAEVAADVFTEYYNHTTIGQALQLIGAFGLVPTVILADKEMET